MKKETLTDIFNQEGGDKGSFFQHVGSNDNIAHNYTAIYEQIMEPYRDDKLSILEIGLWCPFFPGASVKAWNRYFTNATYYGIDIVDCRHLQKENVHIDIVDQKSEWGLENYVSDKDKFKFIIDDGCHQEDAITISLGCLFPRLESGGTYFIEDLHVVDKTNLYKLCDKTFSTNFISSEKISYINSNIDNCVFSKDEKLCMITKL